MRKRFEAIYITVLFGLMFGLFGFFGNLAANYVYEKEKTSLLFEGLVFVVFIGCVIFMVWVINYLEKKLK